MHALETIIAMNEKPRVIRDNFNRDSSFCVSRSGFVIHSGIHRSTAFISKDECPDSWFAFQYWSKQGQQAINAFIVAIIDGASLDGAERNAFHATRKGWSVILPKSCGTQGNFDLVAVRTRAGIQTRVGAATWRHLHARTK